MYGIGCVCGVRHVSIPEVFQDPERHKQNPGDVFLRPEETDIY